MKNLIFSEAANFQEGDDHEFGRECQDFFGATRLFRAAAGCPIVCGY